MTIPARRIGISLLAVSATVAGIAVTVPASAIVNGSASGHIPYVVQVVTQRGGTAYFCGGSLIGSRSVLTAAHCAEGSSGISVRAGSAQRGQGTEIAVSSWKVQAGYDLAVLTLSSAAPGGTVSLATGNPATNAVGDVYGWGNTGNGNLSDVLKTAKVRVTAVGGACKDGAKGAAICTTEVTGLPSGGDSGGPLIIDGRQVGVFSNSGGTSFASVPNRLAWITAQLP